MKRIGNLYSQIYSIQNLELADQKARRGKGWQYGVRIHDENRRDNILALHEMLKGKTYNTSEYKTFKIMEKKERIISSLPYFPDRIAHHAIMNVLEPIFKANFTADTYSCIKGKGIHNADKRMKKALKDVDITKYYLQIDIKKFYPNIDHDILKHLLNRKFKDVDLLWILGNIIDSAAGVPIGNYLSQYLANFYLSYFDHWIKEVKGVKNYFRYSDDIIVLARTKEELHQLLADMRIYLRDRLKLTIKGNYRIAPVAAQGIDFIGYVYFHTHTRLRPDIKKEFIRMVKYRPNPASLASYYGWMKHADCRNLERKYKIAL